jgi:tetratricopeptide (TPR) repeat protein
MKRLLLLAATLTAFGCTAIHDRNSNRDPYASPFWGKYLNAGSPLDEQIQRTLEAIRQRPDSPELHNTLGALLVDKGFPKDAEREFERSVNLHRRYYPAWYNLGLVRAARGDEMGAARAFSRTVALKPGHAAALFQLGLAEEKRQHVDRAVALYAKAYSINAKLLDVGVNPRILDSKLTPLALLKMYPAGHARLSTQFQGSIPVREPAAKPEAAPPAPSQKIVPTAALPQPAKPPNGN